ncbi:MarR family transcriptional regulator [Arthrobacter sp. ERGS1:01]|uniref:MarR family winged helix-turn-helix transcriptional regulator n=1 Tax=Arthrobacter sp. ERGS1:01 TaxID=1704044 RepID=UPI0006B43085|nr:MarR family transcriptional regulator [Arthrobacter sp. ERGS1:01]ALE06438.1 MarR family transcriptional regulator [Arthrobacter sp. ERGS1:01]
MAEPDLGSRFETAAQSPGLALWQVTNRWQAVMRAALKTHDLTHVQYVLLASLVWMQAHNGGQLITQTELAEFAATDRMMTSQVLRALEAKQLIRRDHHPSDGRARVLFATEAGMGCAQRATRDVEAADQGFFSPLGGKTSSFVAELAVLSRHEP